MYITVSTRFHYFRELSSLHLYDTSPFEPRTDLKELDPEFARTLEGLRNYTEEELEALYLDFGRLRPGGEDDDVTKENL